MSELTVVVLPDGQIQFIDKPELQDLACLGGKTKTRVSHVEPINPVCRWLFHAVRSRVADDSWLARFTRLWPCRWQARLLVAPVVLGPFKRRQDAIQAELQWLGSHGY